MAPIWTNILFAALNLLMSAFNAYAYARSGNPLSAFATVFCFGVYLFLGLTIAVMANRA